MLAMKRRGRGWMRGLDLGGGANMERVRFVLIDPTAPEWRVGAGEHPRGSRYFRFSMLSSLYVAAAMPPHVDTRIVDEDLEPIDFRIDADVVGISFMTYNAPHAYEIADRFRAAGKAVIVGGYHPTFMPQEAIAHADAVCVGDAEGTVLRMMEDLAAGRSGHIYRSEPCDLAGLPRPDWSLLNRRAYAPVGFIEATRGCTHQCRFCSITSFHHHRFRVRPVAEVVDELKSLGRHVVFMDDSLICDRDYAKELFTAMIPLGKRWFSQCGIGITDDDELLDLARRSGCSGLFIGFESLNEAGLRSWNKRPNVGKDYLATVRKLHESGIAICAAFVFGGDEDTPDVFERTLEFLLDANLETVQATRLTPFPGTALFADLDRDGRIFDKDWSHYDFNHVVFEPTHMSRETLDVGVGWLVREFHSRRRIATRALRSSRYLDPVLVLGGVVPVNLGWRLKLAADGSFRKGAALPH
jgi:radical SAM superfamily enzyme YgiQ (UPF0313 family)